MRNFWRVPKNVEKVLYITRSMEENNGWSRYSRGVVKSTSSHLESFVITSDTKLKKGIAYKNEQLPYNIETYLDFLQATSVIFKKLRFYDAAHCLTEPYIGPTFVASMLRRRKYYITLHGTYALINFKKPAKALTKFLSYYFATGITTGSLQTISRLPTKYIRMKVEFIPNGYDDDLFFPVKINNDQPYVLTVGDLKPRKGQDISIEAVSFMKHKNVDLICVGSRENSNFFNLLIQKAKLLGVQVEFKEQLSDAELRELYSSAICTILPARNETLSFEGFPMVIYESTACGTPIIITRGCGSEYAISDGKNGFLLESNDPKELASKIDSLMESDGMERMAEHCVEYASLHTWEKVGREIMNFYQNRPNEH